jgi:hypothetical protein
MQLLDRRTGKEKKRITHCGRNAVLCRRRAFHWGLGQPAH